MARASEVAAYRQAQKDVVALAYRDLLAFWNTLDPSDPVACVRALEEFLPDLIQAYGEIGASIAADFYDELRAQSPAARAAYATVLGDAVPIEAIRASTRWAVGPLFVPSDTFAEQTLSNVVAMTQRHIQAHGRRTIEANVERDPARARFARVPSGKETCPFCLVMASRGAVYASEASAGGTDKYHDHCDCVPTPVWDDSDLPEGYDPDALADVYRQAKKQSDGSLDGPDGVLNVIRRQQN